MQQTVTMSNEQAAAFAQAILPAIKGFINDNREEYEAFLKEWNAKKQAGGGITTNVPN